MKTIQELLTEKGFVEGVDYSYDGITLSAIEKTREVEQIVHHDEVPAQYEEQEVLDENGQSFDPPQFQQVEVSSAIPAYDETVIVEETYTESIPSLESLCAEEVRLQDVAMLVSEYLKDKEMGENDSINIDLLLAGGAGWRSETVSAPTMKQLYDLIPQSLSASQNKQLKAEKIAQGRAAREVCEQVLDLVSGYNLDRALTMEQITQMQQTFANAEAALRAGRPTYAKSFISAITADEVLVTQEMKDLCLELLADY